MVKDLKSSGGLAGIVRRFTTRSLPKVFLISATINLSCSQTDKNAYPNPFCSEDAAIIVSPSNIDYMCEVKIEDSICSHKVEITPPKPLEARNCSIDRVFVYPQKPGECNVNVKLEKNGERTVHLFIVEAGGSERPHQLCISPQDNFIALDTSK